jgi:hypothetical protein
MEKKFTLLELHLHDGARIGPAPGGDGEESGEALAPDDGDERTADEESEAGGGPGLKALVALVLLVALAAAAKALRGGGEDLEDLETLDEFVEGGEES